MINLMVIRPHTFSQFLQGLIIQDKGIYHRLSF